MRGKTKFDKRSLTYLEKVTQACPWFQTAQLLYTINLLRLKDAHYLAELHKTSACLTDRRKLFFLLENEFFDPKLMALLEKEPGADLDTLGKIDTFLDESKSADNNPESLVSTDYMTYLLTIENNTPESPQEEPEFSVENQDIIDKFLNTEKNNPIRLDFSEKSPDHTPVTPLLIDNYNFDDEELFSETLAKIYLKQHKYKRALEIFNKLNLVYPEKSSYFAPQIRELQQILNIKNDNI